MNRLEAGSDKPDPERSRNPNGVAMKLANFASLAPNDPGGGLSSVGRHHRKVCDEFAHDCERLHAEAQPNRAHLEVSASGGVPCRYWALGAHPNTYRVMDAIRDRKVVFWTTKGKPIRVGDRVLIWKYRGQERRRGVVGFGVVISGPTVLTSVNDPHWLVPPDPAEQWVEIQFVHLPGVPLWYDEHQSVLDRLVISRVRGGSVFEIEPVDWDVVVAAAGGWPSPTSGPANS